MDDPRIYNNEMGRYKTQRQLQFIDQHIASSSVEILDIGGGSGRLAIPLARRGHRVTVADNCPEALSLLRQRVGDGIGQVCGDILSTDVAGTFDIALAIDMIKYVSAPLHTLFGRVNSILKPDGLVILAEINRNSWRNHMSEMAGRRRHHRYNIESREGYVEALLAAGFEPVTIRGFVWMPLPVYSNSPLVRLFRILEETLPLQRWTAQSPWLLIAARKKHAVPGEGNA